MAQDIEGLIPDGAKKDLEQIDDLWADILAKTIAYVDTVSKLNTTNGVDRTLSSLEEGVNGLSDAYKQYVQGLDDVTAAQKRAADAALKAAKAKTEESKQALNNAKAHTEEAKAQETAAKSKDRAAKESAKIDAAKRKELLSLINDTKKSFAEIDKIQKQYQDNQKKYGAEEIKRQAKEENWSYAQRVAALKAFVAEQKKIVAESDQRIKAIDREIAALDKETNKELDAIRKKNTAYNILSETHKRLKIDAQNAGAEFGIESKQFKEAAASANVLDRQLKEIDGQLGDHRRNVGNYSSAWMGLNRSIGIVLTELPNLGLSTRTFAIAISNNIGQVVEDMHAMVAANKAAAAAGQATIPVWKQVASAIFSWRTLLYVGIAVFTAISAQAGEATDKIKIFTKESDALKDVNTRVSDSYHKQAAELRILKDRFQDASASMEQKQDVIRKLNEKYGDTIGKINSINEAEKFFIERSGAYVEALLIRAQIEGAYDAIAENSKKVLAQQAKDADEATNIWTKFSTYLYSFDKANPLFKGREKGNKLWVEEYNKELENIRRRMLANTENDAAKSNSIIETFIQKQITKLNELSKKFGFGFDQDQEPDAPKETDLTNTELSVQERINKALAEKRKVELEDIKNHQQLIFENEQNGYSKRIEALNIYTEAEKALNSIALNTDIENLQTNLDKIGKIEAKDANKRTAQEKRLLAQKAAFLAEYDAMVAKYTIKENDIIAARAQKNLDIIKQSLNEQQRARLEYVEQTEKLNKQLAQEEIDELTKQFAAGKLSTERYHLEVNRVKAKYGKKSLDESIAFLEEELKNENLVGEQRTAIEEKLAKLRVDADKLANEQIIANREKLNAKLKELFQELGKLAMEVGNLLIRNEEKAIDKRRDQLESQKDIDEKEIELTAAKEKSKVDYAVLEQGEKEAALAKIDEDAAARKLAAEKQYQAALQSLEQQREQAQKKRFLMQQAAAISSVIMETYKEATIASLNPLTMALVPAIIAKGFAGAGIIAAQVLAYADGTPEEGHPGGPAIAGEAGPEIIVEPGQSPYWVTSPTLFPDMPKGTDVIPMDRFLGPQLIDGGMQTVINQAYDTRTHLKAIERAIKNIPAVDMRIEGGAFKKSIRVGNYKTEYIRKHII